MSNDPTAPETEDFQPADIYASQVAILRDGTNSYTLVFDNTLGPPTVSQCLGYDEMLGCIAKVFCPSLDGKPLFSPRQLFLVPPEKQT